MIALHLYDLKEEERGALMTYPLLLSEEKNCYTGKEYRQHEQQDIHRDLC